MFSQLSRTGTDARLCGVHGPVVSTFDVDGGSVDLRNFASNIASHLRSGQAGILVAGSTGEAALLDEDERRALVETAREVVPSTAALLVGIGAESTMAVIRRSRDCAARGVDGVLVVSPHYYTAAMTREALLRHYTAVADASEVPVLLYNIPKYAHLVLQPDLVEQLAEHPNVVGIKDSSGDLELLAGYLRVQEANPTFTVLTGHGPSFATALGLGAKGGILAVSLFTGDITPRQYTAFTTGDHVAVATLQTLHEALGREVVGGMGVAGVKGAMDIVGLHGGAVRAPLLALTDAARSRILELLPQQLVTVARP